MSERRNDIGTKLVYATLGIVLTLFFNHAYNTSKEALAMGNDNKKEIAVLQQQYKEISSSLCEIKKDVKTLVINQIP